MDRKFALWLKQIKDSGRLTTSSCPSAHKKTLEEYLHRDILRAVIIRKRTYIEIADSGLIQAIIDKNLVEAVDDASTRSNAILLNKDSKVGGNLNYLMLSFRSASESTTININENTASVGKETKANGVFSVFIRPGKAPKIKLNSPLYLIENLEAWAEAERYLPQEAIYLHYQGWLSKKLIDQLRTWSLPKIVISPDYDMVGLHNWLKMKSMFPEAELFFPENFASLLEKYPAKHLWSKQYNLTSVVSQMCAASNDPIANDWFDTMNHYGACLEQEALLIKK